jgi:hypothetical protein
MRSLLPSLLARLSADTRGMSLIETAVVIPAAAMLVAGLSDVAMGFSARLRIQQAASRGAELATAAGVNSSALSALQAEAASAAGVSADQVIVDKWLECAGVRQASFDGNCASGEQAARLVSITIAGSYQPKFPLMQSLSGASMPLEGYSAVRVQ